MIANIFFNKSMDINNIEIYDESYLNYLLTELIFNANGCDIDFIVNKLEVTYGNINYSKTKKYVNKHFPQRYGIYLINNKQKQAFLKTQKLKKIYLSLEQESETEILKKLSNYITQQLINYEEGLLYPIILLKKSRKLSQKVCESIFFNYLSNRDKYDLKVDISVNQIDDSYDKLPLNVVISNPIILELLFANGISTIRNLKSLSSGSLLVIFSIDFENIINSLEPLKDNFALSFKDKIKSIFKELKDRELEILSYRNGFLGQEPMTLEEVGSLYNLTRERCRQIEAKATKKLLNKVNNVKNILVNLFLSLCTLETRYISEEKLSEFVSDGKLTRYILFLYEICELDMVYSRDLKVIYNASLTSLEDICQEVIDVYGDIITISEYNYLNSFEKSVVKYSYKFYKNIIYVRKGITTKDLVGMTIDDLFPDGYKIGRQEDYLKLRQTFIAKYGTSEEFPSDRSIVGFMERLDYCQIDKGTYKNRNYCIKLPQDLIEEIINFVLLNQSAVFYSTIYEKFKNKLNDLGVNNYYYLKGLIDPNFPNDFSTKRNYVTVGTEKMSSYDSIINYMKSFDGVFSLDDLRKKFIGVKDYTFQNVIYNECEQSLVSLGNHRYIYISKIAITNDTIKEFKNFIDDTFALMKTNVISSRKIYARLSLLNKDLLNRLKIVTNSFSTLSLIHHFFKDSYGFNRPLISLNKDKNVNQHIIIANYVASLETFNSKTIKNYTSKMNIRGLYSYLEFMEEQSDSFVQINIDTMVAKDKFAISESNLHEIEKILDLIFNRFDEIDTRKFNGYAMFPKLPYLWCKYLLVGIVRSFFSETYEIKNTEKTHNLTDFIIRRI